MKKLALIFSLAALTLLGFSCAKKDNNNTITYQLNAYGQCVDQNGSIVNQTNCTNGYQYNVSGQCVQTSTGQIVSSQLCQQSMTNGYQYNAQGICIYTATGQQAPTQYCQQSNGMYQYYNGICVQTSTGQQVPAQYCQQSGNGMQACVGQYYYPQYSTYINCTTNAYGANTCRGMQLVSLSTGQTVYCQ